MTAVMQPSYLTVEEQETVLRAIEMSGDLTQDVPTRVAALTIIGVAFLRIADRTYRKEEGVYEPRLVDAAKLAAECVGGLP